MESNMPQSAHPPTSRAAMACIGASAACWLTKDTVAAIGRDIAVSISLHRRATGQQPTWAEALTGVNPQLLTPIRTLPPDWPLPAALWRREHRGRLMSRLKFARWVTHTTTPRSLRVGPRGHDWLTRRAVDDPRTTGHPMPDRADADPSDLTAASR